MMDFSLGFKDTHVLITGGAGLIGRVVVDAFVAAGARVTSLDIAYLRVPRTNDKGVLEIYCDISDEEQVVDAFSHAYATHNFVNCCIALGGLDLSVLDHEPTIAEASFKQMKRVLDVNVAGTWLTARQWVKGLRHYQAKFPAESVRSEKNVGLVIVGSESGWFGVRGNADYAMGKSAVQGGLLMSLRAEVPRVWEGARVNAVAPGAVDTARFRQEIQESPDMYWTECQATTALGKPIPPESVAKTILFLASGNLSGHIHGQVLNVDSGKQGAVMWTKDEASRA